MPLILSKLRLNARYRPLLAGVGITREELAALLKDGSELCRELNTRWMEVTKRVFAIQSRLQTHLAEATAKLQEAK